MTLAASLRPPTTEELKALREKRYGRETEKSRALKAALSRYLDQIERERMSDAEKIRGCDIAWLKEQLRQARKGLDRFSTFIALRTEECEFDAVVCLYSEVFSSGFMTGAAISNDLARAKALAPLRTGGSTGGLKTGAAKRTQMAAWQAKAKEVALLIWAKNNSLTQIDLAAKIADRWQNDWPRLPESKEVVKYISLLQRGNQLPRRGVICRSP